MSKCCMSKLVMDRIKKSCLNRKIWNFKPEERHAFINDVLKFVFKQFCLYSIWKTHLYKLNYQSFLI